MKRIFWSELGHAPLFLGIHAMISSIPHKTQMYIEMTLWYVNFISTHFFFFVSPKTLNEIFFCGLTSKSCEKLLYDSTVLQCIFDKKECDARNHKHFKPRVRGGGPWKKKTLREILSEIPLFFSMPSWWHELTPTFNQQ